MKPLVTVFCTTYNQKKYIRECLDSLLNQITTFPYEIIVHDDASTDGTADIILEYTKMYPERIIPILQRENQYSKHIQIIKEFVLPIARGTYIARCEGDDYWCDRNKLEKQVMVLKNNQDCHLCVHKVQYISETGDHMDVYCPNASISTKKMTDKEFISKCGDFFHLNSLLHYREDLVEYYRYQPEYATIGRTSDKPFVLYMGSRGNVYYLDEVMSYYRFGSVNGYTSSLLREADQKKYEHMRNLVTIYKEFDRETFGRYHRELESIVLEAEYNAVKVFYPYRDIFDVKYKHLFQRESNKAKLVMLLRALLPDIFPTLQKKIQNTLKSK